MASYNRVILIGNVVRDLELKHIGSGTAVCELGLAVNRPKTKEGVEKCDFFDCTLWGRTAEVACEYLKKGSSVLIEGRLQLDTWEKDGQKRSKVKVVGDQMTMLGKGGSGNSKPAEPDNAYTTGAVVPPAPSGDVPF